MVYLHVFFVVPLKYSNIRLQLFSGIEGYLYKLPKDQESAQFEKILKLLINSQDASCERLKWLFVQQFQIKFFS